MSTSRLNKNITLIMFLLLSLNVFGQGHTDPQTLNFQNIDGFSGYVKFNTFYEGFATQLKANSGVLVIRGYSKVSREELEALRKAGINLENYKPEKFQFVVEGTAFVKDYAVNNLYKHSAIDKSILKINHNMGDFTTPTFSDDVRKMTKEWSEKNGNQSYWERFGGFTPSRVTELYLLELKNEIDRILQEYKREKAQKEKEEKAKKEASSEKKDDTVADSDKKSTSLKSESGQESKNNENDSSEKENKSESKKTMVYIPKTNTQMYNELKEMTDKNPSLLNNSETRQRLRHLKVDSEREQQINRDYRSGVYNLNSNTLSQYISSNQKIDTYKKVGGDITDAAVGLVNAIYAEGDRKQADRTSVHENNKTKASSKEESIKAWEEEIEKSRKEFKLNVQNNIKETGYNLIKTLEVGVINYETEKRNKDKGEGYWKGSRYYYNPIEFDKITKRLDNKYIYIVETNDLFGILDDAGNAIYPPQFSGIYVLLRNDETPRILIKINDKWGEIESNGNITEEIKYDGIWYTSDRKNKVLKAGNNWIMKSLNNPKESKSLNAELIKEHYAGGLIPVINNIESNFSDKSGSYSLASDGSLYVWGESTEKGVTSIPFELARKGETTEHLFKINNEWYITSGFGTQDMTLKQMPETFEIPVLRDVSKGKKWGVVDQNGKVIVPFEHEYIRKDGGDYDTDKGVYTQGGKFKSKAEMKTELANVSREYYNNGNLKSIGVYDANNQASGNWKFYHENGKLSHAGIYENGLRKGEWTFYHENGESIQALIPYPEGTKRYFFESGQLKAEGSSINGSNDGFWKLYFDRDEKLIYGEGYYVKGEINGMWKYYYENGELSSEGEYLNGKRSGEWKSYDSAATLREIGSFQNGEKIEQWTYYHSNGKIKEIGTYKNGKRRGKWRQYDEQGKQIEN